MASYHTDRGFIYVMNRTLFNSLARNSSVSSEEKKNKKRKNNFNAMSKAEMCEYLTRTTGSILPIVDIIFTE